MTFPDRAMVKTTGAVFAAMTVAMGVGLALRQSWVLTGLIMAPAIVFTIMSVRIKRDVQRRLDEAGGLVCPQCGYALAGEESFARCAECGRVTHQDEAQRFARNWTSRHPVPGAGVLAWTAGLAIAFVVVLVVLFVALI